MRIDSCRTCGKEMNVERKCYSCNEPIVFQCINCNILTDEQLYLRCNDVQPEMAIMK